MLKQGLIQVYTGDGKGKTTCAFGQALRALGRGLKVCVFQFMKDANLGSGEVVAAGVFKERLKVVRGFQTHPLLALKEQPELKMEIEAMTDEIEKTVSSGEFDLVVLDEINNCVEAGLLPVSRVLRIMEMKLDRVELILTGRDAAFEIIDKADLVTNMSLIKHPYYAGVKARRGIEF